MLTATGDGRTAEVEFSLYPALTGHAEVDLELELRRGPGNGNVVLSAGFGVSIGDGPAGVRQPRHRALRDRLPGQRAAPSGGRLSRCRAVAHLPPGAAPRRLPRAGGRPARCWPATTRCCGSGWCASAPLASWRHAGGRAGAGSTTRVTARSTGTGTPRTASPTSSSAIGW